MSVNSSIYAHLEADERLRELLAQSSIGNLSHLSKLQTPYQSLSLWRLLNPRKPRPV